MREHHCESEVVGSTDIHWERISRWNFLEKSSSASAFYDCVVVVDFIGRQRGDQPFLFLCGSKFITTFIDYCSAQIRQEDTHIHSNTHLHAEQDVKTINKHFH